MSKWGKRAFRFVGMPCLILVLFSLVPLTFGCHKSPAPATISNISDSATNVTRPGVDTIVRIHWLGKKKLASDTNSTALMNFWKMPESLRLEEQTLDKLATAPWRLLRGETNQSATNLLHPLLQDLIEQESYVEIRQAAVSANASNEIVLAVRLDDQRASLWQTNVATALESLTGIVPIPASGGWSLKKHHAPNFLQFVRAGDWVVLGAAEDHNTLLDETLARIRREHVPFARAITNTWLQAEFDLPRLARILGIVSNLTAKLPKISLAASGDAGMIHTAGELDFPEADFASLDPWQIPTNLMDADLNSFTVMRGLGHWLGASELWSNLQAGPPPHQLDIWASRAFAMRTYFAAPSRDASNTVWRLSGVILQKTASLAAKTAGMAKFARAGAYNGLEWKGVPYMAPFLQSTEFAGIDYLFGGGVFVQPEHTDGNPPPELLHEVLSRTNLVYYDWERTGPRVEQWIYMSQFARFVSGKAQLPAESTGIKWLKAIQPRLGNAITRLTAVDSHRLSLSRRSDLGFTAIELNLLTDWLESPQFPRNLYTFSNR